MPIYEFYCAGCHRIFNFLSRTASRRRRPACPRCGKPRMQREVSKFAVSTGRVAPAEADDLPALDEARMEQAMAAMAQAAESIDEDNPPAVAELMRRFYDGTGLAMGDGMKEALRRMESGEDPDRIEEEMGGLLEQEDPFLPADGPRLGELRRRLRPPAVDDELYEL